MANKLHRDLLKRLSRAFIILMTLTLIVLGLRFGVPYISYAISNIVESRDNIHVMLNNDFCILRFERNDSTIMPIDKDITDGCVSQLDFDEKYLYIISDSIKLKAGYKVTGKYAMKIFDSDNSSVLTDSEYSVSLTERGINILGDKITIIADKMKN